MPQEPTSSERTHLAAQARDRRRWNVVLRAFRTFRTVPVERRFHHLGLLFEHLAPWIERGIRVAALRHFLLLPQEMVLARLFARAVRREELPASPEAFLFWVESQILEALADPRDELGAVNGAAGEPSAALQQRFNALPYRDRALLYLYMVEGFSHDQVAETFALPLPEVGCALRRIWRQIQAEGPLALPRGWRLPGEAPGETGSRQRRPPEAR